MADTSFPGYLDPNQVLAGVQTADTATTRNREGLPSQRDVAQWKTEIATANAANQANYQMNKENNLLQQQLADKAYERSTAKSQLAELMAAGLTEMQARQAIAGNGEGATAFPVATTQAATAVPAALSPAGAGDTALSGNLLSGGLGMAGDMFGVLTQSLMASDGGALGWSLAQPYMDRMTDLVDKGYLSPDDMATPADLIEYANGLEDGDAKTAILDVAHSKEAYHTAKNPLAHRALLRILKEQFGFKTERQNIAESYARQVVQQETSKLIGEEITGQTLDNARESLGLAKDISLYGVDLAASYSRLRNSILFANREYEIGTKSYKLFVENALKDEKNREALLDLTSITLAYRKKVAAETSSELDNEGFRQIVGYYQAMNEVGMTNVSILGGLLTTSTAFGAGATSQIEQIINNVKEIQSLSTEESPLAKYPLFGGGTQY